MPDTPADIASGPRSAVGATHPCPASRNVIALMGFGIYLIVLPLSGEMVSAQAELTGGN